MTSHIEPSSLLKNSPVFKIKDKDRFSQAINVLLNYWEIKPSQYDARLHELATKGLQVVSSFVPWAHVETDIHHSLKKFLRAAHATHFRTRLFVMPELGVNYPNVGVPKDLLINPSNLAVGNDGRILYNLSAPNIFPLPSFSSPEVLKRFGNYLIKLGTILGEVCNEVSTSDLCELVITNSFFNYYGDYSTTHLVAFREFLNKEYGDCELFKTQPYEHYNRHRYFTHVERLLREKTNLVFSRKSSYSGVRHVDMMNPEYAPEVGYNSLIGELLNRKPTVEDFFKRIVAGGYRNEVVFLGNNGISRWFSDRERSFLTTAALIYSGEVSVMAEDLFKLSSSYNRKLRTLIEFLESGSFFRQSSVSYISASKFFMHTSLFKILLEKTSGFLTVMAGVGSHTRLISERLLFLDPSSVIRLYDLLQLLTVAQSGKIVALASPLRSHSNYLGDAVRHLEKFKMGKKPLRIHMGLPYEIYDFGLGKVVLYEADSFWNSNFVSDGIDYQEFLKSLLGLGEIEQSCISSPSSVQTVTYVSKDDPSNKIIFLINPIDSKVQMKLDFKTPVLLGSIPQISEAADQTLAAGTLAAGTLAGTSFELSVPALGILAMKLSDASETDLKFYASQMLWT